MARLAEQGEDLAVTPQVIIEFWSVATRSVASNGLGWNPVTVADEVDLILGQFEFLDDTPAVFEHWLRLNTSAGILGKQVHDARLVAVMLVHGVTHLLTFNAGDFQRFAEIVVVVPDP